MVSRAASTTIERTRDLYPSGHPAGGITFRVT
jgi:hypothetical protein